MTSAAVENFRYLSISIGITISLTGTVGNLLAILAYASNSKIRTSFNLLVVNLAAVDCIISMTILPAVINGYVKMEWIVSPASCITLAYFYHSAFFTSAMFLVIISFNRYMHVAHPHAIYNKMFSLKRRLLVVGFTWIFSPICLLPLVFTGGFGWWDDGLICTFPSANSIRRSSTQHLGSMATNLGNYCSDCGPLPSLLTNPGIETSCSRGTNDAAWLCSRYAINPPHIKVKGAPTAPSRQSAVIRHNILRRSDKFTTEYSLVMRGLFQLLPLLLMIIMYSLIFRSVKRSHASVDKARTTAYRCESVYFSTETGGTITTPVVTPTSLNGKRNYQLRVSPFPSSPNSRSPIRSQSTFDFRSTPQLAQKFKETREKRRRPVKRSQTENSSDFKAATLRKQTTNLKYASIQRSSSTTEKLFRQSENIQTTVRGLREKQRSATCANFTTIVESNISSQYLNVEKSPSPKIKDTNKLNSNMYQSKRPRNLSLSPNRLVNDSSPRPGLSRRANLSLPNLRKSNLSSSFNGMKDMFRSQSRKRESRRSIRHAKAQRKLLYMCIVICIAFALCSLPSLLLNVFEDYESVSTVFHMLTTNLRWLTCLINPIVYAAMNKQFRKEYSRMLAKVKNFLLKKTEKEKKPQAVPTFQVSETFIRR